jgi:hypothetical protein
MKYIYFYENIHSLMNYILWCAFLYILYPITHITLNKFYGNYQKIYPKHKQQYFISNLLKGLLLCYLSYSASAVLYNLSQNNWNLETIKYLGVIYASTDMVSMFKVEKMQINTIIHHTLVQILFLISLLLFNFNKDSLALGIVVYAAFSTLAFSVNLYLALRLTIKNEKIIKTISTISAIIYQICCVVNWLFQIYFLFTHCDISVFIRMLYFLILGLIIYDDLILIKFLINNSLLTN